MAKRKPKRPSTETFGFVDVFDWTPTTISFTIDRTILQPAYEQSLVQMLRKCPEKGDRRFERIQLTREVEP